MQTELKTYPNVNQVVSSFSGVLLDAYGVFWAGNASGLIPGALQAMERLVASGKIVGILSNATQLAGKEIEKYGRAGILQGVHYHFLITSGEISRTLLLKRALPFPTPKKAFYHLGNVNSAMSSHHLFEETVYTEARSIDQADFLLTAIPRIDEEDVQDPELFRQEVASVIERKLPLLCPNPDLFAHEGSPPRAVVRQGTIARLYREMGGEVYFIGKPHEMAYQFALMKFKELGVLHPEELLMVGDTPETDIRGAKQSGMSSALVTQTGIAADRLREKGIDAVCFEDRPDFFIERLGDVLPSAP